MSPVLLRIERRRAELEQGFNGIEDTRRERIRTIAEFGASYLTEYESRHPKSATFAVYAVGHIVRLAGSLMTRCLTSRSRTTRPRG